jgi:hypothetical protein
MAEKGTPNILENSTPKSIRNYGTRKWKQNKLLMDTLLYTVSTGNH